MYQIIWTPDSTLDKTIKIQLSTMGLVINTLETLIYAHNKMKEFDLIESDYVYELEVFNNVRGEWQRWQDSASGIDDPMVFVEYQKEVLK